jgi:hypothetical protein
MNVMFGTERLRGLVEAVAKAVFGLYMELRLYLPEISEMPLKLAELLGEADPERG